MLHTLARVSSFALSLAILSAQQAQQTPSTQPPLPVLAAGSPLLDVQDGDRLLKGGWRADPTIAIDVYDARRTVGRRRVTFVSDRGELPFDVEPGRTYDFVVQLDGKPPCHTRISTATQMAERIDPTASGPLVIPIEIRRGKLHVRAAIGGVRDLDCILDTGADTSALYPSGKARGVALRLDGATDNAGTGGSTKRRTSSDNSIEVGGLRWRHELLIDIEKQADEADAILSLWLFDGKVVEFDFERLQLIVHDAMPPLAAGAAMLPLQLVGSLPGVEVAIGTGAAASAGVLVLDTGGTGTAHVNHAFAVAHGLLDGLPRLGHSSSRGVGDAAVDNEIVQLPRLGIAGSELKDVPIHAATTVGGEPVPGGVICMEVLQRFHLVLDLQREQSWWLPTAAVGAPFRTTWTKWPSWSALLGLGGAVLLLLLAVLALGRRRS